MVAQAPADGITPRGAEVLGDVGVARAIMTAWPTASSRSPSVWATSPEPMMPMFMAPSVTD